MGKRVGKDRSRWPRHLAVLVLGAFGLAVPASGFIRVDDFREPQALFLADGVEAASGSKVGSSSGMVGTERDVVLRRLEEISGELALTVDGGVGGQLALDGPASVPSALTLVYDGLDGDEAIDPTGLDIDLTELGTEDRFALRLRAGLDATVRVQVFDRRDPLGGTWSAGTLAIPPAQALRWFELPFAALDEMGPSGHADLRDAGAILIEISAPDGLEGLRVDEIRVPEPAATIGGLAVILTLAGSRRLRRRSGLTFFRVL